MKKIVLICILFIISSCVTQAPKALVSNITEPTTIAIPTFVCNKPYIQVGSECCLDENDNKVCDKDETIESTQTRCDISAPFNCMYAEITKDNIHLSLKYIIPGQVFIESISFPSIDCSKYFYDVPKDQWIYDPLTDYSKIEPLKETTYDIPCEITDDYVYTDIEIKYVLYNEGVPFGEKQRYLFNKNDMTYGTLEGEI